MRSIGGSVLEIGEVLDQLWVIQSTFISSHFDSQYTALLMSAMVRELELEKYCSGALVVS
jgi:hypothetical protein